MASADTALETGDADVDNLDDGELDSLLDTDDELSNQELDREDEDDDIAGESRVQGESQRRRLAVVGATSTWPHPY